MSDGVLSGWKPLEEAARSTIIEANGSRISVIAFSCLLPADSAAAPDRAGLSPNRIQTSYEINSYYQKEKRRWLTL